MDESLVNDFNLLERIHNGEFPDTVRHTIGLFGSRTEFITGKRISKKTPDWLRGKSEEDMQKCTVLEVVGAPPHLKGEWKQVFDKRKNIVVKYIPTPEEEEHRKRNMEDDEIYYLF